MHITEDWPSYLRRSASLRIGRTVQSTERYRLSFREGIFCLHRPLYWYALRCPEQTEVTELATFNSAKHYSFLALQLLPQQFTLGLRALVAISTKLKPLSANVIYSHCAFSTSTQSACAVLYCHLWPVWALQHSSTLSHKRHDFRKKVTEIKICVSSLSTTSVWKCQILRRNDRDMIICVLRNSCN